MFWSGWFGKENKYDTLDLFRDVYGMPETKAGISVSWAEALQVATFNACVRVISEGVAQVPMKLLRDANGSKLPARDHPLFDVLAVQPNSWQTSFEWRETTVMHAAVFGNAYSFINRIGSDRRVHELVPILPTRVEVKVVDGLPVYRVTGDDGTKEDVPRDNILHIRGPSWDSTQGMQAFKIGREALALSIALERRHSFFHKNGANESGFVAVDGVLDADKFKKLSEWIKTQVAGDNQGNPLILDRGAKWMSRQMSGVDSEHLATRLHQIEEVCRLMRVHPIMVMHADKTATFASAEQMFLAHVVHTLMPWYRRIEQKLDSMLLTSEERAGGLHTKLVEKGLLRGAAKDQGEFLSTLWNTGSITSNEIREFIDLNPIEGGDVLRVPMNTEDPAGTNDGNQDATP